MNTLLRSVLFTSLLIAPLSASAGDYVAICHASSWQEEAIFLDVPMLSWVIALDEEALTWIDSNGSGRAAPCELSFLSASCPVTGADMKIDTQSGTFMVVARNGDVMLEGDCKSARLFELLPR